MVKTPQIIAEAEEFKEEEMANDEIVAEDLIIDRGGELRLRRVTTTNAELDEKEEEADIVMLTGRDT